VVGYWLLTARSRLQHPVSSCAVGGGSGVIEAGFIPCFFLFPLLIIRPLPPDQAAHYHIPRLHVRSFISDQVLG
jgi:hypothetical protein